MPANIQRRGDSFRVAIHRNGERAYVTARSKADARALTKVVKQLEMTGINVVENIKKARGGPDYMPPAASRRRRLTSSVYLFDSGLGIYKIGKGSPHQRLRECQTGSPTRLTVLAYISCHAAVALKFENHLHRLFARHRSHGDCYTLPSRSVRRCMTAMMRLASRYLEP
jgi:Meiotically up-regulated gene 113